MRYISLFSGIESVSLAWGELGFEAVAFSEIDPFCCALLAIRYPAVPNLGDVTKITKEQIEALGHIDIVVFGFPCTDLSVAGQRKGLKHADGTLTRSGLFYHAVEIAEWARARWAVAENVPGLLSSDEGRCFGSVVGELAGAEFGVPAEGWRNTGFSAGPKGLVEWRTLDAQYDNLAQRRERVFIVRDSGAWADRPPLLLEPGCLRWDTAPRRTPKKDVAPSLEKRAGSSGLNIVDDCESLIPEVAWATQSRDSKGADSNTKKGHLIVVPFDTTQITSKGNYSHPKAGDPCHPVAQQGHPPAIAIQEATRNKQQHGVGVGEPDEAMFTVTSNSQHGVMASEPTPILEPQKRAGRVGHEAKDGLGLGEPGDPMFTLQAKEVHGLLHNARVRRLTPIEVERLQGFPDNWTAIHYRGARAKDSPRYRAVGNAMAIPVVRWIGKRIAWLNSFDTRNGSA